MVNTVLSPSSLEQVKTGFQLALKLASNFIGSTYPNPAVGAAVFDSRGGLLGVGCHEKAGTAHAERDALEIVASKYSEASSGTMMVTLEPCNHSGRTPPCTDAILEAGLRTLFFGAVDTTRASGGAEKLKDKGLSVTCLKDVKKLDWLASDCACLALPFLSQSRRQKPWVVIKQALNKDGNMIPPAGEKTFSSDASLQVAHLLRRSADTILTTVKTIVADDPMFTVRRVHNYAPDLKKNIIILGKEKAPKAWEESRIKDGFNIFYAQSLDELDTVFKEANSQMVLVEAGLTLLAALEPTDIWDEWLSVECSSKEDSLKVKISRHSKEFFEDQLGVLSGSISEFLCKYSPAWPKDLNLSVVG